MKLVRLAVIGLDPSPRTPPPAGTIPVGGISVRIAPAEQSTGHGGSTQVITFATADITLRHLDAANRVVIPDGIRRECESAISVVADLLGVTAHSGRCVLSGSPPVALIPETAEDRALLARASVIYAEPPRMLQTFQRELDLQKVIGLLKDRIDGVAMLAEVYTHTTMAGQYRDLVRFFELAFSGSFMDLHKKLCQTVAKGMGYTADEIREWQHLRHPFSHADGKKTSEVALEADARPVVQRMEQAALDILLNKAQWSSWSSDRREGLVLAAITTDRSGQGVVRQGSTNVSLRFLLLDEFGCFPRIATLQHTNLPAEWWYRFVPEDVSSKAAPHEGRPAPSP